MCREEIMNKRFTALMTMLILEVQGTEVQGTGHCPAGIFKNIISNVTKNEEAGLAPVPLNLTWLY